MIKCGKAFTIKVITIVLLVGFIVPVVPVFAQSNEQKQVTNTYQNPVVPGSYYDPSIVMVGKMFYLVNTTFQFFPGISICESEDLVHWKHISNVLTSSADLNLDSYPDNLGVWACDISYSNNSFYIFYCLVHCVKSKNINIRGNYMVHSKSINSPWSKPIQLNEEGNDPSHFIDDDGEHYMVYSAGISRGIGNKIVKLNKDCSKVVDGPFWQNWGEQKRRRATSLQKKWVLLSFNGFR